MKRLVSTRHPGSDARVNMHAKAGETRVNTPGNLPVFHQMYIHGKHSYKQAPISRSLGVHACDVNAHIWLMAFWVILNRTRPHVQTARFGMTQTISYLLYRLILCIMDLIVFAQCFTHTRTHTRTDDRQICFIFPLNVFPIDHCSKDVINNLKAWLTSTYP